MLQARDRIRAAFGNSGFDWPDRRVTVSLPPADLPKHGSGFDQSIGHIANVWALRRWRGLLSRVRDVFRAAGALIWLGRWLYRVPT